MTTTNLKSVWGYSTAASESPPKTTMSMVAIQFNSIMRTVCNNNELLGLHLLSPSVPCITIHNRIILCLPTIIMTIINTRKSISIASLTHSFNQAGHPQFPPTLEYLTLFLIPSVRFICQQQPWYGTAIHPTLKAQKRVPPRGGA